MYGFDARADNAAGIDPVRNRTITPPTLVFARSVKSSTMLLGAPVGARTTVRATRRSEIA